MFSVVKSWKNINSKNSLRNTFIIANVLAKTRKNGLVD